MSSWERGGREGGREREGGRGSGGRKDEREGELSMYFMMMRIRRYWV